MLEAHLKTEAESRSRPERAAVGTGKLLIMILVKNYETSSLCS